MRFAPHKSINWMAITTALLLCRTLARDDLKPRVRPDEDYATLFTALSRTLPRFRPDVGGKTFLPTDDPISIGLSPPFIPRKRTGESRIQFDDLIYYPSIRGPYVITRPHDWEEGTGTTRLPTADRTGRATPIKVLVPLALSQPESRGDLIGFVPLAPTDSFVYEYIFYGTSLYRQIGQFPAATGRAPRPPVRVLAISEPQACSLLFLAVLSLLACHRFSSRHRAPATGFAS
jgi:hypothetical protein